MPTIPPTRPRPARGQRPKTGDIYLAQVHGSADVHTIGIVPVDARIRFDSFDDALICANRFARERGVDLWLMNPAGGASLLRLYRPVVEGPQP